MYAIKFIGLGIGLLGLVAAFLNLLGYFVDRKKVDLLRTIETSNQGIPRDMPGFEEFLATFPPPQGVDCSSISHIVKDVIQTHDRFPISITLRYLANNQRTEPVASYQDVRSWTEKTNYGWLGWVIAAAGWVTVAVVEVIQLLNRSQIL